MDFPLIIKSRHLGYDGKGQRVVKKASELAKAWNSIGKCEAIAESFVSFDREVSMIAVYGRNGESKYYPLVENEHKNGILVKSSVPATSSHAIARRAREIVDIIANHYQYVGVLVVEFFQLGEDLLVNEIAPRVHNSGHWTIEGAATSQFENHIRAVCGLPLGKTDMKGPTVSYNILSELPQIASVLEKDGAHLHLYGKSPEKLRKLGHITHC
jgi:5-(carboxyamino)imidazole ribonucleotide synthase